MSTPERATAEANRLYWETDTSVADIAEQLGLSRRALYDAIEPLPTDTACETCGSPLVYANRSARTSDTRTCHACAQREQEEAGDDGAERAELAQMATAQARDERERGYAVGLAGVVGAALGAGLTLLLVRRR